MDNNNNMDDLIKKAQEMIKKNQIPDEVKQLMNNMSQNQTPSNTSNTPSFETNNIDMNTITGLVNKLNNQVSDDDMSRLLFALKPYLRNEKKGKVDDYVKLVKMGKMAKLMDLFGGGKK